MKQKIKDVSGSKKSSSFQQIKRPVIAKLPKFGVVPTKPNKSMVAKNVDGSCKKILWW